MNIGLDALVMRFPQFKERIMKQMNDSDEFENLCSDYELCIVMLKTIDHDTEVSQSKMKEYLEIKTALEEEVLKYISL